MRARALISSATVEHYTPRYIWERAVETMGGIDLDPASDGHTVPATRHYTRDDDGLARPWGGRVWLNPPFGNGVVRWFQTLVDAYQAGAVTEAVVLWKAATETKGWYVLTSAASVREVILQFPASICPLDVEVPVGRYLKRLADRDKPPGGFCFEVLLVV